jgi:hypothetical protein
VAGGWVVAALEAAAHDMNPCRCHHGRRRLKTSCRNTLCQTTHMQLPMREKEDSGWRQALQDTVQVGQSVLEHEGVLLRDHHSGAAHAGRCCS